LYETKKTTTRRGTKEKRTQRGITPFIIFGGINMAGIITNITFNVSTPSITQPELYPEIADDTFGIFRAYITDDVGGSMATEMVEYVLENISVYPTSHATEFACEFAFDGEECALYFDDASATSINGFPTVELVQGSDCTVGVFWIAHYLQGNYAESSGGTAMIFKLTASSVASPSVTTTTTFYLNPIVTLRGLPPPAEVYQMMPWDTSLASPWLESTTVITSRRGTGTQTVCFAGWLIDKYGYTVYDDDLWSTTDDDCTLASAIGETSYVTVSIPGTSRSRTITIEYSSVSAPLVSYTDTITVIKHNYMPWMKPPRIKSRRRR
jgi:hypothetical protein